MQSNKTEIFEEVITIWFHINVQIQIIEDFGKLTSVLFNQWWKLDKNSQRSENNTGNNKKFLNTRKHLVMIGVSDD